LHKVPGDQTGSKFNWNRSTGELWCYCETCQALGAVRASGELYGKATKEQCAGNPSAAPKRKTYAES
jgi:uncharacterized protein (DUF169 family)